MKIGLMTWFQYYNYGTALQLTALNNVLKKTGNIPCVIKYYAHGTVIKKNNEKILAGYYSKLKCKVKNRITGCNYQDLSNDNRTNKFIDFYKKYLSFTQTCSSLSELEDLNDEFDAFICGSDQIWLPSCFNPHYYLDFVSDNYKKIAYAPSIGLNKIEDKNIEEQIKNLAGKFEHISTREKSGSKIISDLINRPVKTVLDPTLLLTADEWKQIMSSEKKDGKYLLAYFFGHDENKWKQVYDIGQKLKLDIKIIPVFENDLTREGCVKEAIGPAEFLSYICNADFICTDSFHGTVFALNFNKEFITFERFRSNDKINQNSRIYNILNETDLTNRIFKEDSNIDNLLNSIDYKSVNIKLDILRKQSMEYLNSSIDEVKKYYSVNQKKKNHVFRTHSLCCGCGACNSVCPVGAISIKQNDEGFYTSFVDEEKCISCGKCRKVCPYINNNLSVKIYDGKLYSYKDKSSDVLLKSSSGGFAYTFSEYLLNKNYVVGGCEFDIQSQKARHILVTPDRKEDLHKLQGSKYMQSEFSEAMNKIKSTNQPVAVFGTPCQIAGVRNILNGRADIVLIDLICHGVPSYLLYEKYKEYLSKEKDFDTNNMNVIFRYKPKGWRNRYIYTENSSSNLCVHQSKDPYFMGFEHGLCYSKGCYECPWRDKSAADIRIGDYWGTKFEKDKTGVSMILSLTAQGNKLLNDFKECCNVDISTEILDDYINFQQTVNFPEPVYRSEFIDKLKSDTISLSEITKEYLKPMETKRNIMRKYVKLRGLLKRNGQKK